MRRVLGRLDGDALDAAVGAWLADRLRPLGPRHRRAVAVDGKSLRGAIGEGGRPVHLLAAMDHTDGRCWRNWPSTAPPTRSPARSSRSPTPSPST
jgi:hypothetical protein